MTFIDIIEQEYVIEYVLYVEIDLFDLFKAFIAECMNLFPYLIKNRNWLLLINPFYHRLGYF